MDGVAVQEQLQPCLIVRENGNDRSSMVVYTEAGDERHTRSWFNACWLAIAFR